MIEAIIIAILEKTIISGSLKAKRVIKMDIVKPIPPSIPAPNMCAHFKFFGRAHNPALTPIEEKSRMPRGFPITRPKIIPNALG